ncbi:MAG: hypothetical protein KO206_02930 [Methanomicrobiaceae archaeon]|nr:hypothetical protein [Methanomicrobiaceae archaeon]MDD5419561.1 hypothetical protein [Methanomicrobiaceae archaeon]
MKVGAISAPDAYDALAVWYNDTSPIITIREGAPGKTGHLPRSRSGWSAW